MRSACLSTSVGVRRSICLSGPLHWSSLSTSDGQISIDWDLSGHLSTFGDSIWTIKIRFKISRFYLKVLRFDSIRKKNLNCDKSAACLPTQNGMHELLSKHFCFACNLMQKLHRTNWLIDIVSSVTLWIALVVALWTENSETDYLLMSRVTRPKITSSDIAILTFYWKFICMFIFVKDLRFHLRSDLERFGIWRKMGIWKLVKWFERFWDLSYRFGLRFTHHCCRRTALMQLQCSSPTYTHTYQFFIAPKNGWQK